jgi:DNA polymerase-3 subunit delta'
LALSVAQALVCKTRDDTSRGEGGCGTCASCRKLEGGNHPDVIQIEANEKGNIVIGDIREATNRLALRAVESSTKIVLMFEADRMLPPAQNALLKTLEEPPGPSCFLLTTTRYRTLLPTVRSRAQRVALVPPSRSLAQSRLQEAGVPAEVAGTLAAVVGGDTAAAHALVEAGAAEVLDGLRELTHQPSDARILSLAADWSSEAERSNMALALFEVELRDRLLLHQQQRAVDARGHDLAAAADRLRHARLMEPHHLNRTLMFESLLRLWAGAP